MAGTGAGLIVPSLGFVKELKARVLEFATYQFPLPSVQPLMTELLLIEIDDALEAGTDAVCEDVELAEEVELAHREACGAHRAPEAASIAKVITRCIRKAFG